ncbi:MAG: PorP/SprF family type IX secretion system membrane protein, partial [Bacteroidota bacterium]|nr:PorP/SprF family type IX secretion system membrane protein [Bacteroidota bacterium]
MTRGKFIFILIFYLLGGIINLFAQDIHFSQFNSSPLTLNPAMSGLFDGDYRFILNYRNQWSSVTTPYRTASASADGRFIQKKDAKDVFGVGLLFFNDKAGDSEYGTTEVQLSVAYFRSLSKNNSNYISIGVQPGFAQRTINYTNLKFDNQYDGAVFSPNLPNNEHFDYNKINYFDIGLGINWYYKPNKKYNINTGVSIAHINQPNQSFVNNSDIILDPKLTVYAQSELLIKGEFYGLPSLMYLHQGTLQELTFGGFLKYIIDPETYSYTALYGGLFYRNKDATFITVGLDYKKFYAGLSYDFNISTLKPASNLKGGFELSLIYKIGKTKYSY